MERLKEYDLMAGNFASFTEAKSFSTLNDVVATYRDANGYAIPNRFDVIISAPPSRLGGADIITSNLFGIAYPLASRYVATTSFKVLNDLASVKDAKFPAIRSYSLSLSILLPQRLS
jgi:hypothetical protein